MGGEAFKIDGEHLTTSILKNEVMPTLDKFYKILKGAGVSKYISLGSTGKKERSNDIDIAIGPFKQDEIKNKKNEIISYLKSQLGEDRVKLLGQNIAVMYPIEGRRSEFVQIDVMLSSSPEDTGTLMSGTGQGVKGVYRNLMLAYIAKIRSTKDKKITISFPGGIQVTSGEEIIIPRTENMKTIKSVLEIENYDVSTFETLVIDMSKDLSMLQALLGFEEYIKRYLESSNKEIREAAMDAISFIKEKTRGKLQERCLREIIRIILN